MSGARGDNYLVKIGDNTTSPSSFTTVPCQGDATLNTGKTLEISRTKNCKHPFFREAGYSVQFTMELETPANATQTLILDAADNETQLDVQVISSDSGTPFWQGVAYAAYDPVTMPTEGIATCQVSLAFVNDPTRGAV